MAAAVLVLAEQRQEEHRRDEEGRAAGHRGHPARGGLAETAAEHEEQQEAGQGDGGDEPDEIEGLQAQPLSTLMSSAVASGCLRRSATMIPSPITTSAAATTRTKTTTV